MSESFDREELLKWIDELCAERLPAEDFARLESALAESAEARRIYFDYVDLHLGLGQLSRDLPLEERCPLLMSEEAADAPSAPLAGGSYWSYAVVAVGAFAVSIAMQFLLISGDTETSSPAAPFTATMSEDYVATFGAMSDCTWGDAEAEWSEGWRVMPGDLDLRRGVAEIRFDGGATLVLEGPTRLRIESTESATIVHGQVVLRGDELSDGFSLHTPDATLVDIGTEYAVSVAPGGASEVHVFDGVVLRRPKTATSDAQELLAGHAARFDGKAARQVPLDEKRFARRVPAIHGRSGDADGRLLAADRFDYDVPALPWSDGGNGGFGWAAPWRCPDGKPGVLIRPFPDTGEAPWEVAGAGSLWQEGSGEVGRIAAEPIRLDVDGVYYISFLVQRDGDPARKFLQFRAHENARWDDERMLRMGIAHPGLAFLDLGSESVRTQLPLDSDRPYLLVAKIVAGRARPDQAFLSVHSIDQPIGAEEPVSWTLNTAPVHCDGRLDDFWFLFRGEGKQAVDELRIGRTWRSVTAAFGQGE